MWIVGHKYKLRAALSSDDGTNETWTGSIADDAAGGPATVIGSWSIPSSNGLIGSQGISFTEYYAGFSAGCAAEPYAEVLWDPPTGYNNGRSFPGSVKGTWTGTTCSDNVGFTDSSGSVIVQTGGFIGPFVASVQDAESARTTIVPGQWIAIYGKNLANTARSWNSTDFTNGGLLPTTLDGVNVRIGAKAAPIYYVSPGQLNVQVPGGLSGAVPVTVSVGGNSSPMFTATVVDAAPSLFTYDIGSTVYAAAQHAGGSLIGDPSAVAGVTAATPGETIVFYANGIQASPGGVVILSPIPDQTPVSVTVGGMDAPVKYQSLIEAGVFQINASLPLGLSVGQYDVFSNLTFAGASPNNTGAGSCISGAATLDCGPLTNRWVAVPFTPNGDITLVRADLALGWLSGTNGAVINLVNDSSGLPGNTVLETWSATHLPYLATSNLISLASTTAVTLKRAQRYWFIVEGIAANSLDTWNGNSAGQTGGAESLDQGVTWNTANQILRAFDVIGAPVPGEAAALPVMLTVGSGMSAAGVVLPVIGK
jgi:uncharacterized protein (TIGR03437 family)